MQAIKNLLRPGNAEDDETLYGQENTSNTIDSKHQKAGLTGEGSHLSASKEHTSLPGQGSQSTSNATRDLTGEGGHLAGAKDHTDVSQQQTSSSGLGANDTSSTTRNANTTAQPTQGVTGQGDHLTGSHSTSHQTEGLTGQGSHFAGATQLPGQQSSSIGRGDGLSQPGRQQYPINSGIGGSTTHSSSAEPHSSQLLNKLDPRFDSNQSQSSGSGDHSARDVGTVGSAGSRDHSSRDVGIVGGSSALGNKDHDRITDPSRGNTTQGGVESQSKTTEGPHKSNLMNELDPTVDSDNSKNTTSGAGYSSTGGTSQHNVPSSSTASGPHHTQTANLLDPNVNTGSRTTDTEDAIHHHERHGGGAEEADKDHRDGGKNAAVAGAVGLGAIGMASDSHQSRFTERGAESHNENQNMMPGAFPAESPQPTGNDFQTESTQTAQHVGHNQTSIPDRTRTTNNTTSSVGEKDHHHGQDAALIGGAAGLGGAAHGANKHPDSRSSEPVHQSDMLNRLDPRVTTDSSSTAYGADTQNRSHGIMTGDTPSHQTSTTTPHSSNMLNRADPRIDSEHSQEHHHGRDAALGAGAAGAGYGLGRQHESQPQGVSTSTTTSHSSDLINRGHPRIDNDRTQEQHHSRDAALGAGAAGAGYGLGRQHESQPQGVPTSISTPHSSDQHHRGDPRIDGNRNQEQHHGRDAALGAGAGYGLGRQHESQPHGVSTSTSTTTTTSTTTSGPHSSNLLNRADPRVDSDRSKEKEKDHNYGRDAAVVGGVGAVAYGAHKYDERDEKELKRAEKEHEKQLKEAEKDQKHAEKEREKQLKEAEKDQKHAEKEHEKQLKEAEKEQKHAEKERHQAQKDHDKAVHEREKREKEQAHEQKEHDKAISVAEKEKKQQEKEHEKQLRDNEKHDIRDEKPAEKKERKGLFSFLHRDKNKKYTKEEEDDFDRQERDHNARNVAGGAAVAGAGTYAAHQHHTSGHNSSVPDSTSASTSDHKDKPLDEQSVGSSIGDKLHGASRNRGVPGPTGFPEGGEPHDGYVNHHTGEKVAAGSTAAGVGAAALRHDERAVGETNTHQHEGVLGGTGHSSTTHDQSYGTTHGDPRSSTRDGAYGTSGNKESEDNYNSSQNKSSNILSPTNDQYSHSTPSYGQNQSSTSHSNPSQTQDAAPRHLTNEQRATAAGDGVLDSNSGVKTDHGATGEGQYTGTGHGITQTGNDGRNRLHKDPPADRH